MMYQRDRRTEAGESIKHPLKLCQPLINCCLESSILPTQFYIWLGYRQFSVPHEFVIIMNFYKQCVCFVLFDSCLLFRSTMKLANYVTVFFPPHIPQT